MLNLVAKTSKEHICHTIYFVNVMLAKGFLFLVIVFFNGQQHMLTKQQLTGGVLASRLNPVWLMFCTDFLRFAWGFPQRYPVSSS